MSRLPADKLDCLNALVTSFASKVSKRQLQSLAGSFNFACQVVHGGHTFLRRVIDCVNKLLIHHIAAVFHPCGYIVMEQFPNYLELFPILITSRRRDPRWINKRVCVETDNTQPGLL